LNNPKFSIIIPTYNRAHLIDKTIESVLNQTISDFELIIVDDESKDNTSEIVKNFNDTRISYYYKKNEERGAARNYGIKKAKGQYITFLDSDDLLYPDHFEKAFQFIQKEKPIVFHQQYEIINGAKRQVVKIKKPIKNSLIKGNPISCMGVFIQRDTALKNLFIEDRKISGSEDYELWLRYASKYPFLYNPICTSALIIHNNRSVYQFNKEKLIERKLLMLDYAFKNNEVLSAFGKFKNTMYSHAYSYISLHIALTRKNKEIAVRFLLKSFKTNPLSLFQKRTLAIIKHLFK